MSLIISFGKINEDVDKKSYIEEKLNAFFPQGDDLTEVISFFVGHEPNEIKLLEQVDFPALNDEENQLYRDSMACFLKEVKGRFSLSEGEKVLEDTISYSMSSDETLKWGMPVLRRNTNFATVYFIKPNYRVLGKTVVSMEEVGATGADPITIVITTFILQELASHLLSEFFSFAGEELLSKVFGKGKTLDMNKLLDEISKMIKLGHVISDLRTQAGLIDAVQMRATTFYENEKEANPSDKKRLLEKVEQMTVDLNEPLTNLSQDGLRKPGISIFITGANIMLALLEEKALVDPRSEDYKKTAGYKDFKDWIKKFSNHVKLTKDELIKEREDMVTPVKTKWVPNGGGAYGFNLYFYEDTFTGKKFEFTDPDPKAKDQTSGRDKAEASRNKYIYEIDHELDWIEDVLKSWKFAEIKS